MTYEKSADDLEMAAHLQDQLNAEGRYACQRANAPQSAPGVKQTTCVACGEDLPPVRIEYKRIRCAVCQTEVERLTKLTGRR